MFVFLTNEPSCNPSTLLASCMFVFCYELAKMKYVLHTLYVCSYIHYINAILPFFPLKLSCVLWGLARARLGQLGLVA